MENNYDKNETGVPSQTEGGAPAPQDEASAQNGGIQAEESPAQTESGVPAQTAEPPAQTEGGVPAKKKRGKKAKPPKMLKAKKLPGLLKKSYLPAKLEKKILRRVYIDADREYIKSLFTSDPNPKKPGRVRIDREMEIEERQVKRLKKIAKDVKGQKFGFKIVPFAAVVAFIAALCILVQTFKNVLVKKGIKAAMQGIFQAKTDIAWLDFDIMGARLEIKGLAQADKDEDMRNIFEIGDIIFDFNLTELLRGKCDIQNITMADLRIGTERKTSGYIPHKTDEEKAAEKAAKAAEAEARKKDLLNKTQNVLTDMFAEYNPENIIKNVSANLKSPAMAEKTQKTVEEMIARWKEQPEAMKKQIDDFTVTVNKFSDIDWERAYKPDELREMLTTIDATLKQSKKIGEETEKTFNAFKNDSKTVANISKEIGEAVKADAKVMEAEINKFKALKDRGIQGVFTDLMTAFVYGMADQYSPKIRQYINYGLAIKDKLVAQSAAAAAQPKKAKKEKKKKSVVKRAKGRYVYYKNDNVPRFLLEKLYGSGETPSKWMLDVTEVSSDYDKRGRPTKALANFDIGSIGNDVALTIDGRSNIKTPVVQAKYVGSGIPMNVVIDSYGMKSSSVITAAISGGNGSFGASGTMDLSGVQILTPVFEPKIAYDIYLEAINSFTNMTLGFDARWTKAGGLDISIKTDLARQFARIFIETFNRELKKIIEEAKKQVSALLSEKTGGVTDKIAEFMGIENLMDIQNLNVKNLTKKLEDTHAEIQRQLQAKGQEKKEEALKEFEKTDAGKVMKQIDSKTGGALKNLDKGKDLKDLFKR